MSVLEFVSQIVAAVAWPACVLAVVLILREPVTALLPNLRIVRWGRLRAEFTADLERARVVVESQPIDPATAHAEPELRAITDLAAVSPRAAVLEAWRWVEVAARQSYGSSGVGGGQLGSIETKLRDVGAFDESDAELYRILRRLRNRAAHQPTFDLDPGDVAEYAAMASHLVSRIDSHFRKD